MAGGKGLAVMDIGTDPAKPIRIGDVVNTGVIDNAGCPSFADSGSSTDGVLFVAGGKALGMVDITDPRNPKMSQKINTGVLAQCGGCAMVTDVSDQVGGFRWLSCGGP